MTAARRSGGALLLALALGGCALNPWYEPPVVQTKALYFLNAENTNQNQSVAFDLVIIYEPELVEKLLEMSARQWFSEREQLKRDHPSEFFTWEWEIAPGQVIPLFPLRGTKGAQALLVFANYASEGVHRARLDPFEVLLIDLQERQFEIRPVLR